MPAGVRCHLLSILSCPSSHLLSILSCPSSRASPHPKRWGARRGRGAAKVVEGCRVTNVQSVKLWE
jgi:hypothetical protein